MNAPALAELAALKQGARATWAAGDYPAIAERQLWEVGPRIVAAVGVRPGEDVLDVACGTGNAALRAAQAGAPGRRRRSHARAVRRRPAAGRGRRRCRSTGSTATPRICRSSDECFDVVLSTFGCGRFDRPAQGRFGHPLGREWMALADRLELLARTRRRSGRRAAPAPGPA